MISAFPYHSPVGYLTGAIKIHRQLCLLEPMCEALAQRLEQLWQADAIGPISALVPIPMHPSRLPVRGFNHAVLIADQLGKRLGLPVLDTLVVKKQRTVPQHDLEDQRRRKDLSGVFQAQPGARRQQQLALIDDVITTGSTMTAVARALRKQGHHVSQYWALASALKRQR
ncbi:hypothetical protein GCM10023333_25880 [Ferrimonas pelagia]|uniref:ComF family protein n=1 Tax=Ferrimonas pelagia TaxID=1177826 RepID=A0ABP9F120_9GAMM